MRATLAVIWIGPRDIHSSMLSDEGTLRDGSKVNIPQSWIRSTL